MPHGEQAHALQYLTEASNATKAAAGSANANVRRRFVLCKSAMPTRASDTKATPPPMSMAPNTAVVASLKPGPTLGRGTSERACPWRTPSTKTRTDEAPSVPANQDRTLCSHADFRFAASARSCVVDGLDSMGRMRPNVCIEPRAADGEAGCRASVSNAGLGRVCPRRAQPGPRTVSGPNGRR